MGKIITYVGTYSEVLGHVPHGKGRGIELFEFDTETGALTPLQVQDGESFTPIWNSSWVTLHPSKPLLFAVEETAREFNGVGSVVSYRIENNGKLTQINKVSSSGTFPCHASVDASGKYLAAANYGSGNVALISIAEDGTLNHVHTVQHSGKSVNEQRQEGPHAHQALFIGDSLFVVDLGIDAVVQYKLVDGKLVLNTTDKITFPAGNGPRHIALHPTEPVGFVAHELNSTLSVCSHDASTGTLKLIDTKSTTPVGFTGGSFPSEVEVSRNGKFVYVANRGPDHIAIFKYSSNPAVLETIGHISTEGEHPRHFTLSPDGKFLLVGNQNSDTIVIFKVDENSGSLQKVHVVNVATPAIITFFQH